MHSLRRHLKLCPIKRKEYPDLYLKHINRLPKDLQSTSREKAPAHRQTEPLRDCNGTDACMSGDQHRAQHRQRPLPYRRREPARGERGGRRRHHRRHAGRVCGLPGLGNQEVRAGGEGSEDQGGIESRIRDSGFGICD